MSAADLTMVSAYMAPPGLLSLSPVRHDHNLALWTVGSDRIELRRYWELERITGEKHHRTPIHDAVSARHLINALLRTEGVSLEDVDIFVGTPGIVDDAKLTGEFAGSGLPMHSLAHLFSAIAVDTDLLRSGSILGMTLDGGPDFLLEDVNRRAWYAGCVVRDGRIDYFQVESPGQLWRAASRAFGREEGTLMALASACTYEVPVDPDELIVGQTFYGADDVHVAVDAIFPRLCELVQARVESGSPGPSYDERFDLTDNVQSAVMKSVQSVSELVVARNVERALEDHDVDSQATYLALAGGYALNCPSNTRILDDYGFRGLLAPPCVNDSGQALGLGLMAVHARGGLQGRRFALRHAFHGPADLDVEAALERFEEFVAGTAPFDLDQAVEDLLVGEIAWVRGAAEIGPRALGHRSLLADPRTQRSKDRLNEVKQRQWWRPVAPIVLEHAAADWFAGARPTPYMLEVFQAHADKADLIPAALHLDGTARVQTLSRDDDPATYELIDAFAGRTGIPLLCNTSLNDHGEPLVANAVQALNFCVRKGISVLYIDNLRISVRPATADQSDTIGGPEPRDQHSFHDQNEARARLWSEWTRNGLSAEALFTYADSPPLRRMFAAHDVPDPERLRQMTGAVLRLDRQQAARIRTLVAKYGPPEA